MTSLPLLLCPRGSPRASGRPSDDDPENSDRQQGQGRGPGRIGEPLDFPLQPEPDQARYATLDACRGAACIMLLLYHTTFYAEPNIVFSSPSRWSVAELLLSLACKLWIGVPIFFVISGYCIAASIDPSRRRQHSLWDYMGRRFRRIYPPFWTMCLVVPIFVLVLQQVPVISEHCRQLPQLHDMSFCSWVGNFAAAEAWRHHICGDGPTYLMANTWTLCYEEQFYVVTGILVRLFSKRFFLAAAFTTGLTILSRHGLDAVGISHEGFFWDGHWLLFAVGILVYHALTYQTPQRRWWTYSLLAAGMVYGIIGRVASSEPVQQHLSAYTFVAAGFGLGLIGLRRWDKTVARHWLLAPFAWCGRRSYSIYLTHYPLVVVTSSTAALAGLTSAWSVVFVVVPFSLVLSLPVASLFHVAVERRFLGTPR